MKVAIVFPSGHLTTTPCITSLAVLLSRNNIEVDIYTVDNMTSVESALKHQNLKIFYYPVKQTRFYENIPSLLIGFFLWWSFKMIGKKYDYIIAAGIRALIITGLHSLLTMSKYSYIYLSLELYIKEEMQTLKEKIFKKLEILFNKRAVFTLIQDDQRAKILQLQNHLLSDQILIYPNSYLRSTSKENAQSYVSLLDNYKVKGKKIAIVSGAVFAKWAMTPELIKSTIIWPDDWQLLIHSRAKITEFDQFLPKNKINSDKIIFSNQPLNDDEYEKLVKSSYVGIALYDGKISENINYVGYSSGKIAQYLKCGVPIIVSNLPLLNELVENYHCGFCVNDTSEIVEALSKVKNNHKYYSEGAKTAYKAVFDPELYIDDILIRLANDLK